MRSNFLGGAYTLRSLPLAAQSCINIYLEPNESGSGEPGAFYGTPGLLKRVTLGSNGCRGSWVAGGYLWTVFGGSVYRVDSSYGVVFVGSLTSTDGPVSMADNGTDLVVAHSGGWHAVNLASAAIEYIENSPTMADVAFLSYRFIGAQSNGTYCWTDLNSTNIDPLSFASAEAAPDPILRSISDHGELLLFGSSTTEIVGTASDADLPFIRLGTVIEQGILAPHSAAKIDNSVLFLGSNEFGDGVVYVLQGNIPARVSTFAIEQAIASYADPDQATAYAYQQDGHHFYVLSFAEATWVYDLNTKLWHQRAYRNTTTGLLERHRGNGHAFYRGQHFVGDYADGRLYVLDLNTYTDDGDEIYQERSWHQMDAENRWITFNRGELIADMGLGLDGSPPSDWADPQAWLSWSNDGGRTWSNEHNRSLGRVGEYNQRAIWRRMGKARTRYFKLRKTAATRTAWRGFNLDMEVANA